MNIENILISAEYLEFINELDKLIYELLYSENGYIVLNSKQAIKKADQIINKFDFEVENLKKDKKIDFIDELIQEKRNNLINEIQKHYNKELLVWVDEIYNNLIDNILFNVSLNKLDKNFLDLNYNRAIKAIEWYANINKLNDSNIEQLKNNFNDKYIQVLNSDDNYLLNSKDINETDKKLFLDLRELILIDYQKFLKLDLLEFKNELSQANLNILNKYKNSLLSFKKTMLIDELNLVNSAIKLAKIIDINQKYEFITQIEDDFNYFYFNNKKLDEVDKINIVKRRIKLLSNDSNQYLVYYKNLIT